MNTHDTDTIAAIATAPAPGAIAVIRISGPETYAIADRLFRGSGDPPSRRPPQTFAYGHVRGEAGESLDEVLMLFMRAPHSFTREDVVEIHCHGGRIASGRILRRTLDAGARLADPGEFTRRAFLNGRIDLVQAEAVMDLIAARSERAATAALEQLEGSLSQSFNALYHALVTLAGELEATLDFPDDELPDTVLPDLRERLQSTLATIDRMLQTWQEGRLLRDGATLVITGSPNAGKSTLLNALLGIDRAIVSHLPGTTRDLIEEYLVLDGIPLRLVDTAGVRESACSIEQEGVRRTQLQVQSADLTILVVDASQPLSPQDHARLHAFHPQRTLVVLNKTDLGQAVSPHELTPFHTTQTSLLHGIGLDALRQHLIRLLHSHPAGTPRPQTPISERHRQLLLTAKTHVATALDMAEDPNQEGNVLAANYLREAIEAVASATGRAFHDDLLDSIFSRFCIGK